MKKLVAVTPFVATFIFASDPITIDSLFKKQVGLRSVTNLSLLTTGNANSYATYPNLSLQGDPII